ncbi:UNVERIFIED_CONTAM: RNA-dependent RNA polymerase 1 [Sesamum angustifolium]|uniref:RNA-dependent RNA polymerase n=1 Tax=Sesamum angustifolium TaxID=2727405 RepID=A0AAW2IQ82_9LAMI
MGKTIQVSGFPYLIAADVVKKFLEQHTGQGTIVALEMKPSKKRPRAYARVQFAHSRYAEMIQYLASTCLYYGTSYLRVWESDSDIVHNPRTYMHEMEQVTLNFGCQTSREKFSVLWKAASVSVKFGTGLKKMHFLLCHNSVEYKLQLSYENIWQIVLYHPRGQTAKLLLIQLFGAPRIYKKVNCSVYSYFSETQDDQWIRTTDFTPSCIGQSSGLCLELPYGMRLPNFEDHFVYYSKSENPFHLEKTGCLPGPKLDARFFQLVNPQRINTKYVEHALEKLYYLKECCYDPATWLMEQYQKYQTAKEQPKSPAISLDDGLVYVHRVQVTPTKVYFSGPEVNVSNRVLRHFSDYIDNFLRVSFVDEEWDKMYSTDLSPRVASADENGKTKLYERILKTLREGIRIGNKNFEFLAFSSSQLRDNSLWMFAPTNTLNAHYIRQWMGDFRSIRNVAKIPDIEAVRGGIKYIFSDGIGKISPEFARRVAVRCGVKNSTPSAFQIRYGGYKGVVAVDPISSVKLSLRPSMLKYQSENTKLDVLAWSKYQPCFLNRQIITLLSTLGVKDHAFERKQREAVAQLDDILVDPLRAQEALDLMAPGENTNILKEMLKCGYKPDGEPFLSMMLQTFRASKLLDLRMKARIFVPQGRKMMGCLDETGTLEYGEVFVQFSGAVRRRFNEESIMFNDYMSKEYNYMVEGKVVVAKNPCLHPGDVRVLKAVDVKALHHMVDCVVFPKKGMRWGHILCLWDSDLIPPRQVSPMDYDPAPTTGLDHDVTIEEVEEYFTNYIVNDSLGIISNAHTVFADKEESMALSESCLALARLFSIAVDFPKTGVPAEIPSHLRVLHERSGRRSYDPDMEVDGFKDYIDEAFDYKTEYDYKLGNLMEYYGIKTEAEILSGAIMKTSKTFDRRKDAEAIGVAVRSLRNEARSWFKKGGESDDPYAKASAWYHVTYHPDFWGSYNEGLKRDHYISFPWCVYDKLIKIKKDNSRRVPSISSLEWQFGNRLGLR